ncbi:IS66 family transposase [Verrucomicrobiales bacterium]|nr:IS66 family transposase [Verrucomicrobiales bacterium]
MRVSSVIDRVQIITPQKAIEYLQLGAGKTARGYLWPVLDPLRGAVHYSWKLGRGHEELVGILSLGKTGGFSGTIQCDGFSAYETLARRYPEIQLGGCLAHIRRKFHEAREQVPEVVMPILPSIQRLYRIEENLRQSGAPPGCRELVRRSKSRPIVNELQKKITAELGVHLPKSNPGKALRYALGQWSGFARYMKDGRLEIDNNLVENAIRPTKLGAEKQR